MADGQINLDLTGYRDRLGERVAPGRYRVIVEDAEQDLSKQGNTMINLWLRVVGGEFNGSTIVDRLVITDKSLFRIVGFMQAIGMPTPKKKFTIDIRKFVGRTLEVDLEDGDPWNGKVKSEVRGYLKVKGVEQARERDLDDSMAVFAGTDLATEEVTPEGTEGERKTDRRAVDSEDITDQAVDLESLDLG